MAEDDKAPSKKGLKHIFGKRNSENSLDLEGIKSFWKNWGGIVSVILLVSLLVGVSLHVRVQPWDLHVTDSWAQNHIYNLLKNNIRGQVDQAYPNLPEENKQRIVDDKFAEIMKQGTLNIQGQDVQISQYIKDNANYLKTQFQDEEGKTYLLGLDEYYWYRLAGNVVKNGHEGTIEKDGQYYDGLINAGAPLEQKALHSKVANFHTWLTARSYNIVHAIDPTITLMQVIFFIPAIISTLGIIPAFFIGRKMGGNIAGFIAGLIVALHPAFLGRSVAGTPDTDAYVITLPLFAAWLFLEACDSKVLWKNAALALGSAFFVGLFAFTWTGWFFIVEILLAALVAYLVFKTVMHFIRHKNSGFGWAQGQFIATGTFIIGTGIFVSMFLSFTSFINFIKATIGFTQLKQVATTTIWPNVLTTVAELNPSQLNSTLSQISYGNQFLLWLAMIGFLFALLPRALQWKQYAMVGAAAIYFAWLVSYRESLADVSLIFINVPQVIVFAALMLLPAAAAVYLMFRDGVDSDIKYGAFIIIWFVVGLYAGTKGVRFVMLLVPPFALAIGSALGRIFDMTVKAFHNELSVNRHAAAVIATVLALILVVFPVNVYSSAMNIAKNEVPLINDVWFDALTKIKAESQPDAIINSWWDFGHWFAAIADRPVTLDGGRQNQPQAHWLGKLMLTGSEDESVGILRMLDCGANTAFNTIWGYTQDDVKTINLLNSIIPVHDRDKAKRMLMDGGLSDQQAETVLKSTHCQPPEDFFITSEDMVSKSGVWAHFGAWNLTKASMYMKVHDETKEEGLRILKQDFGLDDASAQQYFREISTMDANYWVSAWPSYAGGLSGCSLQGNLVQCGNGVIFNRDTEDVLVKTQMGDMRLKQVAFIDKKGNFKVDTYDKDLIAADNGRWIGGAIIQNPANPNDYASVLMDDVLVPSMFTRLFYFRGEGLSHFDKFYSNRDITGADIFVWKIDWKGESQNDIYTAQNAAPAQRMNTTNETAADQEADETPTQIDLFAKCIADSGAKMYGASWCSHCQNQKRTLGDSEHIPYIQCDVGDTTKQECIDAGITAYPTWIIDGKQITGEKTIAQLSELTGCELQSEQ